VPFVAGPTLNVFNGHTLKLLADMGASRWVMAPEMSRAQLLPLLAELPEGLETEIFAYGRIPLAWSARCFTARHYNLQKDACEFRCLAYPDGLALRTREGEPFLTLNGIQTQSAKAYNLLPELSNMAGLGVALVRLSPQSENMSGIIHQFRACLTGAVAPDSAWAALRKLELAEPCNGFWYGKPGLDLVKT